MGAVGMKDFTGKVLAVGAAVLAFQLLGAAGPAGRPSDSPEHPTLDVDYAKVQVQLAEANLKSVRQMNRRLPGAVSAEVVAQYQQDVEVANACLQGIMRGNGDGQFPTWLRGAEMAVKAADDGWRKAVAANQRMPGTVEPLDIERLRLRAELARLQLEQGRALVGKSREAQLQWQVNLLHDQVRRLNEEVLRTPPSARVYPWWWY
jgi:hypothetical protein